MQGKFQTINALEKREEGRKKRGRLASGLMGAYLYIFDIFPTRGLLSGSLAIRPSHTSLALDSQHPFAYSQWRRLCTRSHCDTSSILPAAAQLTVQDSPAVSNACLVISAM